MHLDGVGKRFDGRWVLRDIDIDLSTGDRLAVVGPNGSGKSTLLRLLCGFARPSEGRMTVTRNDASVPDDDLPFLASLTAPALDLIEEYDLGESIAFHTGFLPARVPDARAVARDELGFPDGLPVQAYSSGMQQRLKLFLALVSDTPIVLLDEPTSNLDAQGVAWYMEMVERFAPAGERIVVVASNDDRETTFCTTTVHVGDQSVTRA